MEILREKLKKDDPTNTLKALIPEEECVVIDKERKGSFQTTARRITKKTGEKFTFRKHGDKIKIWKLKDDESNKTI